MGHLLCYKHNYAFIENTEAIFNVLSGFTLQVVAGFTICVLSRFTWYVLSRFTSFDLPGFSFKKTAVHQSSYQVVIEHQIEYHGQEPDETHIKLKGIIVHAQEILPWCIEVGPDSDEALRSGIMEDWIYLLVKPAIIFNNLVLLINLFHLVGDTFIVVPVQHGKVDRTSFGH